MGTIVQLYKGCYLYELPELPREEDILFYNLPKKEQYWRAPQLPDAFQWKRLSKQEQYEIIDRERYRWLHGVWFMNFGVPTYITGMHYDHLVYMTFEFGKAAYFDSQRLDFYFRDYTRKDPKSFGRNWLKPRRYGMTLQEITEQTYTAIETGDRLQGMMSDNKDKTYDTIFSPLVQSYLKRPKFIRPDIYMPNGRIPRSKLEFRSGKVSKAVDEDALFQEDGCLNSLIQPKPTTMIGYDGWKLHYLTMDEVWKWKDINPYACWEKQKKCFMVGSVIQGKTSILSTMGDDDSYASAIEQGIKMWYDSDPMDRLKNGQTQSGLYRYFISGLYSQFDCADKYGFINIDQATNNVMESRAKYPVGSKDYMFECRRVPLSEEEALATANTSSIFDYKRIQRRIEILTKTAPENQPSAFYDLNELPNGRVEIEPKKWGDGMWQLCNLPKVTTKEDRTNRWYKDESGQYHLYPNPQGCIGYDAVRYAEVDTTSSNVSMAAAIAMQKFDYYGNNGANRFNALYHRRPDETQEAHYEVFKLCKLLGYPVMPERQVDSFRTSMIGFNAFEFVLRSPYDGKWGIWTSKDGKVVKDGVDDLQAYWKPPKTFAEMLMDDYIDLTEFIELLKQAQVFSTARTTKFDVMMATIMMKAGLRQIKNVTLGDDFMKSKNGIIQALFPKRN